MSDYLLKANIILALLYAFYRLFFYRDTFFKWRRAALLGILAVAVLAPLPWTQMWLSTLPTAHAVGTFTVDVLLPEFIVTPEPSRTGLSLTHLAAWIYGIGVCLLAVRILIQCLAIGWLGRRCPRTEVNGMTIHALPEGEAPFSFFRQIFVCPTGHTPEELDEILVHEQTHARQVHSLDVLAAELACTLGWFNPFVWLWKREVRQNLEYLADQSVLTGGHDRRTYQYHLLGLAYHKAAATIYNNFNVLPLKKRIRMMNKQKSKSIGQLKYLLFVPVAALLAAACAGNQNNKQDTAEGGAMDEIVAVGYGIDSVEKQPAVNMDVTAEDVIEGEVYDMVEQAPQFPGGPQALMKWIGENVRYPVAAQEAGVQGRVICQFVIQADGTVGETKILRGVSPELDAEALRIVKAMPAWTPGMQDGQAVNVRYTLPVTFRLQ